MLAMDVLCTHGIDAKQEENQYNAYYFAFYAHVVLLVQALAE